MKHGLLEFSASWYHGPSLLPPYMLIQITPKDRDFKAEILIDIESLEFLHATLFLRVSEERTEVVPVLIKEPDPPEREPDDWLSIIGTWRGPAHVFEITRDEIKVSTLGKYEDYPKGRISPIRPGVMSLALPSGDTEIFLYERKGDILVLSFQRASGIGLARLGSAADTAYQRRNEFFEPDSP